MTGAFVWQVRVYWEDTDAGGVVYHARYLHFFERARTEWLRSRGVIQSRLSGEQGLVFAIRHMDIDFFKPARMDDALDVTVQSVEAGATRLRFEQDMTRQADGKLLSSARVTAACLDAVRFKPARIPSGLLEQVMNP
ncbi:MAG: tol-pal system-associated acyl-CoA thioesterase [Xanthomonadales bacterium]|nr:tol-pal system-associated acyl-CoA thioesterase [Xanthomonadales bacterium]